MRRLCRSRTGVQAGAQRLEAEAQIPRKLTGVPLPCTGKGGSWNAPPPLDGGSLPHQGQVRDKSGRKVIRCVDDSIATGPNRQGTRNRTTTECWGQAQRSQGGTSGQGMAKHPFPTFPSLGGSPSPHLPTQHSWLHPPEVQQSPRCSQRGEPRAPHSPAHQPREGPRQKPARRPPSLEQHKVADGLPAEVCSLPLILSQQQRERLLARGGW